MKKLRTPRSTLILHTLSIYYNIITEPSISSISISKSTRTDSNQAYYLRMVSDTTFHGTSRIVMLNPKSYIGCQSTIILWYGTLNLIIMKYILIKYS
jgi:hypothetical protein